MDCLSDKCFNCEQQKLKTLIFHQIVQMKEGIICFCLFLTCILWRACRSKWNITVSGRVVNHWKTEQFTAKPQRCAAEGEKPCCVLYVEHANPPPSSSPLQRRHSMEAVQRVFNNVKCYPKSNPKISHYSQLPWRVSDGALSEYLGEAEIPQPSDKINKC